MIESVFRTAQQLTAKQGFALRRQLPERSSEEFFSLIRPVATEHELVRLGGPGDGGYLVPDDLEGIVACFSPGVDKVANFERDLIAREIRSFQIDASVEESPLDHPMNEFERKFLGIETTAEFITLDDWVEEKAGAVPGDLILQMDIEGAEWSALAAVSDATLQRFRVVVLEMHHLAAVFEPLGQATILPVLRRLDRHFDLVHLHANNASPLFHSRENAVPGLLEATFLRKDRVTTRKPLDTLPHRLDEDCVKGRPPVHVPPEIYNPMASHSGRPGDVAA